eukprot:g2627.t1
MTTNSDARKSLPLDTSASKETLPLPRNVKNESSTSILEMSKANGAWVDCVHPIFRNTMYFDLNTLDRRFEAPKEFRSTFAAETTAGDSGGKEASVNRVKNELRLIANGFLCAALKGVKPQYRDAAKTSPKLREAVLKFAKIATERTGFDPSGGGTLDLSNGLVKLMGAGVFRCLAWTMMTGHFDKDAERWILSTNLDDASRPSPPGADAKDAKENRGEASPSSSDLPSMTTSPHTQTKEVACLVDEKGNVTGDAILVSHRDLEDLEDLIDAKGVHVCPFSELKMIDLSNNDIRIESVFDANSFKLFVAVLKRCVEVKGINLNYNPLGSNCGRFLGTLLRQNRGLHTLCLRGARLGNRGVKALVSCGLHDNFALRHLDLDMNCITDLGATVVSMALAKCGLRELRLCRNRIGSAGLRNIGAALRLNPTLVSIWFDENDVTDAAQFASSTYLESPASVASSRSSTSSPFEEPSRDTSGLQSLFAAAVSSRLQHISLVGCVIGDDGLRAIAPLLIAGTHIESVDMRGCAISERGAGIVSRLRSACCRMELNFDDNAEALQGD